MIKAVVYDCDGVIVDSKESILAYYNRMMDRCGLPPIDWTEDEIRQKAFSMADKDILEVLSAGDKNLYNKMLEISRNDDVTASFDKIVREANRHSHGSFYKQGQVAATAIGTFWNKRLLFNPRYLR